MKGSRVVAAVVALGALIAAAYFLPLAEWTIRIATYARGTGAAGVAVFVTAYIVSTVAALPGSLLTLAAGFTYGPVAGLAVASPASVAGATAAFLMGRTFLRKFAERRIGESPLARAIDTAIEREGLKLVLLLRLSPLVPFNLLNYMLSLSRVRTGSYVLGSFLGMLPGTAAYVYLGSLAPAAAEITSAPAEGAGLRTGVYAVGLVATIVVAVITTRAARQALKQELSRSSDAPRHA